MPPHVTCVAGASISFQVALCCHTSCDLGEGPVQGALLGGGQGLAAVGLTFVFPCEEGLPKGDANSEENMAKSWRDRFLALLFMCHVLCA